MNNDATRRTFLTAGAALAAGTLATSVHAADEAPGLKSRFLFSMTADLEPPQVVGKVPEGQRMVFYAKGGTLEGPRIKGTVLPGGGDWYRTRPDGVGVLDVRASFKADDDAIVFVHYKGLTHSKTEDGSQYFRVLPQFETASEKYGWLNRILSVGVWKPSPGPNQVSYDVYEIL